MPTSPEAENAILRDLLYEDWKNRVLENAGNLAPVAQIERWYFDQLLERLIAERVARG